MFCNKFQSWFRKVKNFIDKQLINNIDNVIAFVDKIKAIAESKILTTIIDLTPFKWDNVAVYKIHSVLEKIALVLGIIKENEVGIHSAEKLSYMIAKNLKDKDQVIKDAVYFKLASSLTESLDKRYASNVYDTLVQSRYSMKKS